MTTRWAEWDHIVKIDPDKTLVEGETFEDVCETGTDAIEIGGTTGMTTDKMQRVIDACATHDVPLYLEPSAPEVAVNDEALDGYLIPTVLNAGDPFWTVGAHKEWARMEDDLPWDRITTEAYVVMNPEASVATYTEADCDLSPDDVAAYAEVAEEMFGQEIVYIEYSGTLGDPAVVEAAADATDDAALFYGGGVHDYDSAHQMGEHADVVVVGDLVHAEGVDAVEETVRGAKDA
ncbi:phosphoglycerol geranylgeranyltransferase [Natronoarchaeum philippinense]|uniref:Geranylgeranylglyceryl phosphate synthase n=1 Tax=Natronoarchaeum philippinense TaxID=558529 RepID=A0A285NWB0_NATPI|nr:putative phosphoglycerol geranylgeranyltransferase [Natronoarchaeum philippinense]SNZ13327.1 phosphoglycerol geranylgeranyltransferase [Natronoarchaeum philippinense]